jgi:hypothetical protein
MGAILFLISSTLLAVDATQLDIWASDSSGERIDTNPQQREDGCEQDGPDDNNGRHAVLPAHEPFEKWVQVDNHPEGEEEFPE